MLLTIATTIFSVVILLLLAASATKVFSNTFHPREEYDYDDEDEYIYKEDQPLQHPSNYTDYR